MKTEPQTPPPSEVPAHEHWDVPLRVGAVPYLAFSQWLEVELEKLVNRWQDKAAPSASKTRRQYG